jgi:hypothetical protein
MDTHVRVSGKNSLVEEGIIVTDSKKLLGMRTLVPSANTGLFVGKGLVAYH